LKTFSPEEEEEEVAFLSFSCSIFPSSNSTIYTYRKELRDFKQENSLLNGGSDGLVYDETFVRHWDEWKKTTGEKLQVQIVRLSKNPSYFDDDDDDSNQSYQEEEEEEEGFEKIDEREGKWGFELELESSSSTRQQEGEGAILKKNKRPKVISPMQGSKLECPVGPFGSTADFSISKSHLLIHSKDPNVSPSWHTRTNVYILPFYPRSKRDESEKVEMLSIGNQGASSNPIFVNNHDHEKVAWFEMREDGYEADRNRLIVYDLKTKQRRGLTEDWDSSPSANLESSLNGESLFMTAEERGHVVLYEVGLLDGKRRKLTERDSISSVCALRDDRVLLSIHSFTSPNQLYLLSTATTAESTTTTVTTPPRLLASLTRKFLSTKTLSQAEEFLFLGSKGQEVHGWILFPPTTTGQSSSKNDSKLLPLANLCHGGPQSAWNSSWSTRWNPQSYTLKGYVTVMINRTGSTGFGQKFCDEIKQDWGGAPFQDLVAGIDYVKKTWKNKIDPERMANLGGEFSFFFGLSFFLSLR
jgi:dipeptidyl aminopeptidase/acylaminoacyl peptidase